METRVKLFYIRPNPWQARLSENEAHARKIADDIRRNGLMQIPVGRLVTSDGDALTMQRALDHANGDWEYVFENYGGRVQLAFGNTRLQAYRLLNSEVGESYARMPVIIRDLSDQRMFEQGISENLARKDLNPIEEATAMERYRTEFSKNSVEIGDLFGKMSDSAVRNKIRLLKLPAHIQKHLQDGDITEGQARALIALFELRRDLLERIEGRTDGLSPHAIVAMAMDGASPKTLAEQVQRAIGTISFRPDGGAAAERPVQPEVEAAKTPAVSAPPPALPVEKVDEVDGEDDPQDEPPATRFEAAVEMPEMEVKMEEEELVDVAQPAPAPKQTAWEMATITLTLTMWPGPDGQRMVALGARSNQNPPIMRMSSEGALGLSQSQALNDMINELKSQFGV